MAETSTEAILDAAVESEAEGLFPPFDTSTFVSQLLWLAITFGILYYVMSKIALPRIATILEERNDRIADDLAEAERLRRETDETIAAYEQSLAEAKHEAHEIAARARQEAKAEIAARQAKLDAEIDGKLAAAQAQIDETREKAMAEVGNIARETAEAMVAHLIGTDIPKSDIDAAVQRHVAG